MMEDDTGDALLKRIFLQTEGQSLNIDQMCISNVVSCRIAAEGSAAKREGWSQTSTYSDTSLRCGCVDQNAASFDLTTKLFHQFLILSVYDRCVTPPLIE